MTDESPMLTRLTGLVDQVADTSGEKRAVAPKRCLTPQFSGRMLR
jgi:hypothetical protein